MAKKMAALSASPSEDYASMMQSRKHRLALSAQALLPLQRSGSEEVDRGEVTISGASPVAFPMTTRLSGRKHCALRCSIALRGPAIAGETTLTTVS